MTNVDGSADRRRKTTWVPRQVGGAPTAYEQVADEIRAAIVNGELAVGDKLPTEVEMAKQFNVSRGTLREALRVLASLNLITTTRGVYGGSIVTNPSPKKLMDHLAASLALLASSGSMSLDVMLEARELLELPAARLAATRHTEQDLEGLLSAAKPSAEPFVSVLSPNQSFHARLARAAGNPMIEMMLYPFFEVQNRQLNWGRPSKAYTAKLHREHRRIATAVGSGDPDAAEAAMRKHFETLAELRDGQAGPVSCEAASEGA